MADNKSRDRLYSGFKKLLAAPALVRRSSDSFSFVNRLSSLSMSAPSPAGDSGGRASINSLTAKGYNDDDLSAAARAAADELMGKKRERRPSFSFASWREKHRSKKHPEPIAEDRKPVQPEDEEAPQQEEPAPRSHRHSGRHSGREHRHSGREKEQEKKDKKDKRAKAKEDKLRRQSSSTEVLPPMGTQPTPIPRTPGNQITPTSASRRASTSATARPTPLTPKYSFTERHQENSRITDRASTMVVDDVVVRSHSRTHAAPVTRTRPGTNSWDSDSEDEDRFEDSNRVRGMAGRSISMDFIEPQQAPNHLMSKIWRKLPIQARLLGRGSIDLDLEKDRVSFSRSSQSKAMRKETHTEEFSICASPLPTNEEPSYGKKSLRFNFRLTYFPSAAPNVALESYDDILVRVCQFAKHDTRRTAVKVQEFLERSMAYVRGTTSRRGQKVSISNEEIRMWRRLARHDWEVEEITTAPLPTTTKTRGESTGSSVTEDETDPDEDDVIVPDEPKLQQLVEAVNYCVGTGDSLFTIDDVEELIKLEFLVEEDGWI